MPARIDVPGLGPMYFPDNMSDAEIRERAANALERQPKRREPTEDVGPAPSRGKVSAEDVYGHLMGSGMFTPHLATGVIGNLIQESGLDPSAVNPDSGAYGMGQWLGPRKKALFNYAEAMGTHPSDPRTQMDFLLHELRTSENKAYSSLLNAGTPEEAAKIFSTGFERAGKDESRDAARMQHARNLFNRIGGTEVSQQGVLDPADVPFSTALSGGIHRGIEGVKGSLLDLAPAQLASALGYDDYSKQQLKEYEQRMADIQEQYPQLYESYKNVRGISDVPGFVGETVGESLPSAGAMLGGGVLGAATRVGAGIGMGAAAAGLNIPETFNEIYQATGKMEPLIAAGFGAVGSVLDTMVPGHIWNKFTAPERNALIGKTLEKLNVLPKPFAVPGFEGLTEGTQQVINNLAANYAGAHKDVFEGAMDATIRGAIGGAALGAGAAPFARGPQQPAPTPEIPPVTTPEMTTPEGQAPAPQVPPTATLTPDQKDAILRGEGRQLDMFHTDEDEARIRAFDKERQAILRGKGQQVDMFPAELTEEKALQEQYNQGARGPQTDMFESPAAPYRGEYAGEKTDVGPPQPPARPATPAITSDLLDAAGVDKRKNHWLYKQLVGKDLSVPEDRKAVEGIVNKIRSNPRLAESTKSGIENVIRKLMPYAQQQRLRIEGAKAGTPEFYTDIRGLTPQARDTTQGAGAGAGLPSGPEPNVPPAGAGISEAGGMAPPVSVPSGSVGGAPAQPGALVPPAPPKAPKPPKQKKAPTVQYPAPPVFPEPKITDNPEQLRDRHKQLDDYLDGLYKALDSGAIDFDTHLKLRDAARSQQNAIYDVLTSPEHMAHRKAIREKEAADKKVKDAEAHASKTAEKEKGKVVWGNGDLHLIQTQDANGLPKYTATKGGHYTTIGKSIDETTPERHRFSEEDLNTLKSARDAIEQAEDAKHAATPYLKFDRSGLAFSKDIPKAVQKVVAGWKRMLGINANVYFTTTEDALANRYNFTGPHRVVGNVAATEDNYRGITGPMPDGSRFIMYNPNKSVLANLEMFAHELGHIHEKEAFAKASPEMQDAIRAEHKKWVASVENGTARELLHATRTRKTARFMAPEGSLGFPAKNLGGGDYQYLTSFAEWYADQVARWATTSEKPLSIVDKFFARLGAALRRFFGIAKNQGYLPNTTFKEYMDNMVEIAALDAKNKSRAAKSGAPSGKDDTLQKMSAAMVYDQMALPRDFSGVDGPFKVANGIGDLSKKIPFFSSSQSEAVSGALHNMAKGARSLMLSMMPGYALSDTARNLFPEGMAPRYHDLVQQHDGAMHQHAEKTIEPINNIFRRAMNAARGQHRMFDNMVDLSTKNQVDPSDPQSVKRATQFSMGYIEFNSDGTQKTTHVKYFDTAQERNQAIREHNKNHPAEERAFAVTDSDAGTAKSAREVKHMWDQLKPEWKELYVAMRNGNSYSYTLLRKNLSERIDSHDLEDSAKIFLKKNIFTRMAEAGMIRPYFALTREGDHWLSAEMPNQHGVYENLTTAFTDPLSREKFATDLKNTIYKHEREKGTSHEEAYEKAMKHVRSYSRIDEINYRDLPSSSAINEIFKIIDRKRPKQGENESVADYKARMAQYDGIEQDIMQLVIKAMPETSILKSLQKRENTPGNLLDSVGSYERKQRSMSRQLANLKYRPLIRKNLEDMAAYADALGRGQDETLDEAGNVVQPKIIPQDNDLQVQYVNAFRNHAKYVLNPTPSDLAGITKSAIFGGTMAFNPSSAIIEASNVPMIAYPYLSAEYGMAATRKALWDAHRLFKNSGNTRKAKLQGFEEGAAPTEELKSGWSLGNYEEGFRNGHYAPLVDRMARSGLLNRSQLYENLLSSNRTTLMDKWNAMAGWMLHVVSRHNREVIAAAAYDLEYNRLTKKGMDSEQARALAADKAIYAATMTNGSVAAADAPRFAHNALGSIVMMYKRFGVTNTYMQYKMLAEAYGKPPERLPHETEEQYRQKVAAHAEEAKIMKKRFWRLQLATAALSGIHGLPMYGAIAAMYNLYKDDDDEDADTQTRKAITELFFNGPLEAITGIAVASRIGLSGVLFKEPRSTGDTSSFTQMMMDSLGGPLPSMIDKIESGISMIQNGNVERGMEALMPAFIANIMKGIRYMATGKAETLRGDPIYGDVDMFHGAMQILGLAPAEVQRRQEFNAKQMGIAKAVAAKDSNIKGRYYKAYREHDLVGMREARDMLIEFGQKHPQLDYTPATVGKVLHDSAKRHDRDTKEMLMGKHYSKKQLEAVKESARDQGLIP